jgi:hypothetical protein
MSVVDPSYKCDRDCPLNHELTSDPHNKQILACIGALIEETNLLQEFFHVNQNSNSFNSESCSIKYLFF